MILSRERFAYIAIKGCGEFFEWKLERTHKRIYHLVREREPEIVVKTKDRAELFVFLYFKTLAQRWDLLSRVFFLPTLISLSMSRRLAEKEPWKEREAECSETLGNFMEVIASAKIILSFRAVVDDFVDLKNKFTWLELFVYIYIYDKNLTVEVSLSKSLAMSWCLEKKHFEKHWKQIFVVNCNNCSECGEF